MDDIAKNLGVSKKTIYQNFKDKNELINILIRDRIVNQDLQMNKCFAESENAVQELFLTIQDMDYFLATMNPMLFYDLQKYHQQAWLKFMAFKEEEIGKIIFNNLERGIKEGLYRKDINIEIVTRARLDQIDLVFTQTGLYDTNKYSLASIMVEITRLFLFGICNYDGLKLIHHYDAELAAGKELTTNKK